MLPQDLDSSPAPHQNEPDWNHKRWLVDGILAVFVVAIAGGAWYVGKQPSQVPAASQSAPEAQASTGPSTETAASIVQLAADKSYGDKYANGLLPVGDGKYSTTGAKKGSIYVCHANFVPSTQAGAQKRGPWFTNNNTQYDINKKSQIAGSVSWIPTMSVTVADGKRVISTNDLPVHKTGQFPVASTDPARIYDANPNTIKTQLLTYTLAANPTVGTPSCMGGEVGVMLTGVALYNGFDAGGRDAGAWEVQDGCDGHPQDKGAYHYHTLSRCIADATVDNVLGYALDGFPITGPKVSDHNILTTDDLDECHGITGEVLIDGKKVKTYHYVMTQDFPYSVSCFRGPATKAPGLPESSSTGGASGSAAGTTGQPNSSVAPPAKTPPPRQAPPPPPAQ